MVLKRCMIFLLLAVKLALRVQGQCGGSLQGITGSFQSPEKWQLYSVLNDSKYACKWTITKPSGGIRLVFTSFSVGKEQSHGSCDPLKSVAIIEDSSPFIRKQTLFCGSKLPPIYYSQSSSIDVILRGHLPENMSSVSSFAAEYSSSYTTTKPITSCGSCGGHLYQESGMLRSPNFPVPYPNNCDCKWTIYVQREHYIKLNFWSFSLEKDDKTRICNDYLSVYDGTSTSSPSLGKFCGSQNPGTLKSSKTHALVHFHSDSSKSGDGFEIMFQSVKDTRELNSLRSIAAILGGVSFGIFIFLLICSVIYKKYINNDNNRGTSTPQNNGESDYLDAVQAAAPPSYQAVMADPEHYPRTPEITPSPSPVVTPSLLRRNMVRSSQFIQDASHHHLESLEEDDDSRESTPPPPYPGSSPKASDEDILIADLPPPPTYEMVSDSEEHGDSHAALDPTNHRVQGHSILPAVTLIQNGSVVSSCAGDGCCHSDGHIALNNHDGRFIPTYRSCATRDDSEHRTANRRTSSISRHRSDSALRDRLISYDHVIAGPSETSSSNSHRRESSDDSSVNYHSYNETELGETSDVNQRRPPHIGQKDRSCSTPAVLSGTNETNLEGSQTTDNNSPSTHRSLFHRHSLFVNRIQPDSPRMEGRCSGNSSPRTPDSRHNNRRLRHMVHFDSSSSSGL